MEFFTTIFHEIFFRPLFNGLIVFYNLIPGNDFGIAIVLLTCLIRLVFFPLSQKAITSQKALALLQPEIREIQEKHKNDKEKQSRLVMDIYRKHKINPFSGCLPILIQLPIFIALYQVFLKGLDAKNLSLLYTFVPSPDTIHPFLFNFIDLSLKSSATFFGILIALLAGASQFVQSKTLPRLAPLKGGTSPPGGNADFSRAFQDQMTFFMPIFTVVILWNFPVGLGLYWLTSTLFSIGQQLLPVVTLKANQNHDDRSIHP